MTAPALIFMATAGCDGHHVRRGRSDERPDHRRLPASVRRIATFSVGYEHVDVRRGQARIVVSIHTRTS